jgi:hypothetical protein
VWALFGARETGIMQTRADGRQSGTCNAIALSLPPSLADGHSPRY